jgi:hypothetical protein
MLEEKTKLHDSLIIIIIIQPQEKQHEEHIRVYTPMIRVYTLMCCSLFAKR